MSSVGKDARWAWALQKVEEIGLDWEDITGDGHSKVLAEASAYLEEYPEMVESWYLVWKDRQGE